MAVMVTDHLDGRQAARVTDPFEHLFMTEYARVVAIACRVLNDASEAEDVAQDVFVSFHRRHNPAAPYAASWLHAAAVHTCLNVLRGKRRRARREQAEFYNDDRASGDGGAGQDPQRVFELSEQRREVRAALARLPRKSAAVLALRYSGLSYAEVAAALNVRSNQVGTLLRRAEAALQKELTDATP